jgi:hypothetical protein
LIRAMDSALSNSTVPVVRHQTGKNIAGSTRTLISRHYVGDGGEDEFLLP